LIAVARRWQVCDILTLIDGYLFILFQILILVVQIIAIEHIRVHIVFVYIFLFLVDIGGESRAVIVGMIVVIR
jgi:hypothetical protein